MKASQFSGIQCSIYCCGCLLGAWYLDTCSFGKVLQTEIRTLSCGFHRICSMVPLVPNILFHLRVPHTKVGTKDLYCTGVDYHLGEQLDQGGPNTHVCSLCGSSQCKTQCQNNCTFVSVWERRGYLCLCTQTNAGHIHAPSKTF